MKKPTGMLLSVLLIFSLFSGGIISADSTDKVIFEDKEAFEALNESVYVNTQERTAHLDKEKALELYDFTDEELDIVESKLKDLTDEQIQTMISYAQSNNDGPQTMVAPVIVWGGVAVLGIFAGTALIFASEYLNYLEKKNLVDKCYEMGGTPSLDNGDTAGLYSAPKKAWWKFTNTYDFECVE